MLTVIGAATLLVAVVGATFAYFSATGESTKQSVTTGSAAISILASDNVVKDIKPTSFVSKTAADANTDIEKIKLTMSGTGTTSGYYTISMNQPEITLNTAEGLTGGQISDIKYAIYGEDGNQIGTTGSFTGAGTGSVDLVSDVFYAEAEDITEIYTVYVWIENSDGPQNQLQDRTFNLTFTANAVSGNQNQ